MKTSARHRHIFRVTIVYGILAALWILLSDALLVPLVDPAAIQWLSTVKGLFFVLVTTLFLFLALRATPDRPGAEAISAETTHPGAAPWSGFWGYLFAVVATLATLLLRLAIPAPLTDQPMMVLFMFPVILSAMAGGLGPGLTATFLAALWVNYFALPPRQSLAIAATPDLFQWGFLIANGVLISWLSEKLHRLRRQSEALGALYQDLVNAQPAGIYRIRVFSGRQWDISTFTTPGAAPHAYEMISDRFCEIIGATRVQLIDNPGLIGQLIHPDDYADFINANREANATLTAFNWEGRIVNDGKVRWVHLESLPRPLANRDVLWTGLLTDISARKQSELALRESQAQFTLLAGLLERSSQPFAQGFPDGRLGFHNQAFLDLIGYSAEELAALDWARNLTPPEWLVKEREHLAQLHATGQPVRYEKEYLRKDGSRVPIELLVHLATDEEDQPLYYYSFITNLSTRNKALEALRESETTYRSLFDNMLNGLAHCRMLFVDDTPEDFVYLTVNDAFEKLTGLQNVEGRKVSEVIPGIRQADPELFERFGRVARGGAPERFEIYVTALHMWFWLSVYSPKPDHFVVVFDVISELKKAELALRENEARLRAISDNLPDGYIYQSEPGPDGKSRFLYISAGVTAIHGLTPEEVVRDASLLYRQVDPAQTEALLRAERKSLTALSDFAFELHVRRPDSTWRWLYVRSRPRRKTDGQLVWDGVITDITARKAMEGQLLQAQKMEFVGRLAGGVAHDFNNMLTVIGGHAELAIEQTQPEDPRYQDLLEIQNAARRSANLTRQLLAFARKQTVSPVVLDINDTLTTMLKMLQRLIGEDIDLAWEPGHELWRVKIDPSQIDQLLANLAVNARDAIAGVGKLTIETANRNLDQEYCAVHPDVAPGDYVELAVSDTGCGMDGEVLAHLFEPFFTTKQEGEGTGLGLATVYGIVKQNRGAINVYSEPGQGTTFRIYLPRHAEPAEPVLEKAPLAATPGGSETVLIVEDDPTIMLLGKRFVEKLGYRVLTATSPGEAIRLVEGYEGGIDLLLTDVVMPEMNGKQLATRLREIRPGLKCLFMSGYTADAIARQGVLDEGICFLAKPFSAREMAVKIREALEQ